MVVIVIVALLVFGPSRLPEIARTIKRGLQEWNKVKGQVDDTISELKHEIDLKSQVEDPLKPIFSPAQKVSPRKPSLGKKEELLQDHPVSQRQLLNVGKHDDYLTQSADDLYPPKDAVATDDDDYLGNSE